MSEYARQPEQGQPYYPHQPYPVVGTNTMAVLSLVFAFVFSPLGIVFGHIAKGQIRRTGEAGSGLATAGLVLSYVFVVLAILWIAFVVVAIVAGVGAAPAS
jgi:hypothetical protein